MATAKLSKKLAQQALDAKAKFITIAEAADSLKLHRATFEARVKCALRYGLKSKHKGPKVGRAVTPQSDVQKAQEGLDAFIRHGSNAAHAALVLGIDEATIRGRVVTANRLGLTPTVGNFETVSIEQLKTTVLGVLKQQPHTVKELAQKLKIEESIAQHVTILLAERGHNIFTDTIGRMSVEKAPKPTNTSMVCVSTENGRYSFGVVSDTHLCSKYYRADVLEDLYDWFEREGITQVFHAGNWIDGEARFNKYDLEVHGMDAQCRYMIERYPQRPGITTYAVAGDDHEGWYNQREGVDIGKYLEMKMRDAGRNDWVNLGYMESFVTLQHAVTGKTSQMLVMHPGGGSAYAVSYQPQKIIESLSGGEKPAVILIGHYHKLSFDNIRNTWALQCGTTKDQDPFMRKKRIEAHVGGSILDLWQDQKGAIPDARVHMKRYFNKGYYEGRWSLSGPVTQAEMSVGGV